jgi:hypothetical protein
MCSPKPTYIHKIARCGVVHQILPAYYFFGKRRPRQHEQITAMNVLQTISGTRIRLNSPKRAIHSNSRHPLTSGDLRGFYKRTIPNHLKDAGQPGTCAAVEQLCLRGEFCKQSVKNRAFSR